MNYFLVRISTGAKCNLPCASWCTRPLDGAQVTPMVHKMPSYGCHKNPSVIAERQADRQVELVQVNPPLGCALALAKRNL